jgi:hypothetical protein
MVFTGDHFNSPEGLNKMQEAGTLSQERADDLRNLPMQDCDVLLHESGAPPIHTPLDVLLQLPDRIKKRMYVVHTATLPEGCELRVAPTGTAGTIRLDNSRNEGDRRNSRDNFTSNEILSEESMFAGGMSEYETISEESASTFGGSMVSSFAHLNVPPPPTPTNKKKNRALSMYTQTDLLTPPPLVSLRPASSTDAWFILNLLSAVPFLSRYV